MSLGLAICVAPHGLQQTAGHSFARNPPGEKRSPVWNRAVKQKGGDNLRCFRMGPIWRPSFGPRGTDVQIRTLAWLLCIASRLSNSVLSSIMRPYTPHTLADVGIRHPAVRSGMERAEPRANASTQALPGQAYEYVELDTRARCKMMPSFCTEHMVFSRPDPARLTGTSN